MPVVSIDAARELARKALSVAGTPPPHAALQTDVLIEAELRGVPSHGLLRLPRLIRRIRNGVADPATEGLHTWAGGTLSVDGRMGLGPVVTEAARRELSSTARKNGIAVAGIKNANHIGMLAYYADAAARDGLISIVLTTSEALVHPWGGRRAMVGTNPIAIGVPTADGPFSIDLATSVVSMGEIHDRAHRHEAIPAHWALDAKGVPTTDPEAAKLGAIAPFGEAKGYALGLAFELLVTAITGAAIGTDKAGTLDDFSRCNKGDVLILIDPPSDHGKAISAFLRDIRNEPPAQGFSRVLVPGDRAMETRRARLSAGLPVADEVWDAIEHLAKTPEAMEG